MLLINAATVARVRKRFVEEGLEAAINDKSRPGRERKLDGKQEAHPSGCHRLQQSTRRTCDTGRSHLLADKVVELEFAGTISLETVRRINSKKRTSLSRGRRKNGAFPR